MSLINTSNAIPSVRVELAKQLFMTRLITSLTTLSRISFRTGGTPLPTWPIVRPFRACARSLHDGGTYRLLTALSEGQSTQRADELLSFSGEPLRLREDR